MMPMIIRAGWEERAIEVGIEAMKILIRKDREA